MFDKNNDFDNNDYHDDNFDYPDDELETKSKKKYSKGFYFAFAICLITMVSAAFLTYTSVSDFLTADDMSQLENSTSPQENEEADVDIKGVEKDTEVVTENVTSALTEYTTQAPTQAQTASVNNSTQISEESTQNTTESNTVALTIDKELQRPVLGEIIKQYSDSTPVYSNTLKDWRVHNAVDYKAEKGETVNSIDDGVILEITSDSMYGTSIVVEHNSGFTAYYANVNPKEKIVQGAYVSMGDVLGTIDEIPCESSDGMHLHLTVMKDGAYVNPELLFVNNESQD